MQNRPRLHSERSSEIARATFCVHSATQSRLVTHYTRQTRTSTDAGAIGILFDGKTRNVVASITSNELREWFFVGDGHGRNVCSSGSILRGRMVGSGVRISAVQSVNNDCIVRRAVRGCWGSKDDRCESRESGPCLSDKGGNHIPFALAVTPPARATTSASSRGNQ